MDDTILFKRLLDRDNKPDETKILKNLGNQTKAAWDDLREFLKENYHFLPETVFYGSNYGWSVRYRRSGKTLCCLFPEKGAFSVLIVLGRKEIEKTMLELDEFSNSTKETILNTKQLHDGRWLWFRVTKIDEIEDIKKLINIKRKPKRA